MALDYQSDISPLKQQFFPMLTGGAAFDANMNYHQSVFMPMQQQTMKLQNNMLRMQEQELSFERQKLALDSARRRAQMETETMAKLPELQKRLSSMFDDPNKSSEELAEGVGALTMEFAPVAAYNPSVQSVLQTANSRVRDASRREYKQNILDERDERRRFGMMSQAAQIGETDIVRSVAAQDDVITPDEELYIKMADSYKERGEQKQQAALQEQQFKMQEAARKETAAELNRLQSALRSLKVVDPEDGTAKEIAGGKDGKPAKSLPKGFEFEEQSRYDLEAMVAQRRPDVDISAIRKASDQDLYRELTLEVARQLGQLSPQYQQKQAQRSRILSGFDS